MVYDFFLKEEKKLNDLCDLAFLYSKIIIQNSWPCFIKSKSISEIATKSLKSINQAVCTHNICLYTVNCSSKYTTLRYLKFNGYQLVILDKKS